MSIVEIEISGMNEILQKLETLPDKVVQKIERGALKKALQPIFDQMLSLIPVGETGNLANSAKIVTRTRKGRISGRIQVNAPHAHLVEYGHRMVAHDGREVQVSSTGTTRVDPSPTPRGFARPALDSGGSQAVETLRSAVEEELKKLGVSQ